MNIYSSAKIQRARQKKEEEIRPKRLPKVVMMRKRAWRVRSELPATFPCWSLGCSSSCSSLFLFLLEFTFLFLIIRLPFMKMLDVASIQQVRYRNQSRNQVVKLIGWYTSLIRFSTTRALRQCFDTCLAKGMTTRHQRLGTKNDIQANSALYILIQFSHRS